MQARFALEGEPIRRVSSVYYRECTATDPEGGEYLPIGHIRIFRTADRMPKNANEPAEDVTTVEACRLAHEYGHHRSKVTGTRTPEYEAALDVFNTWRKPAPGAPGRCPSKAEQALILAEEDRAWTHAHSVLKDLGVTAWSEFVEEREHALANYRTTFENMEKPEWVRPV